MKRYKDYLNYFQDKAFGTAINRFEDKLLLFTTLSITAILIVSTVFNIVTGLKASIIITSLFGTLLYIGLYLFGRFVNRGTTYAWIVSLVSLIFTDVIWFTNYGSYGPIMPLFVVLYAFFILVFDKKAFQINFYPVVFESHRSLPD